MKKIEVIKVFWIFMIGSFIGYILEMIVVLFQKGYFESRQGLIYGPFIPVYGVGAIIYYIFYENIKIRNKKYIFLFSMLLGGITEYLFSYFQEKIFGTVSWDYSNLFFNINGRTSLLHCTYWGVAGMLYISFIEPIINKIGNISNKILVRKITYILIIFMITNILITCMAGIRQKERVNQISANSKIDILLDKCYPDKFMNSIFTNKMERQKNE